MERLISTSDQSIQTYTTQPQRHWTKANMRKLLEKYAKKQGLDPLRADTWYSTPERNLRHYKVLIYLK